MFFNEGGVGESLKNEYRLVWAQEVFDAVVIKYAFQFSIFRSP